MFTGIIEKYGIVPKYVMPESYPSSNSVVMNKILNLKLRDNARILRNLNEIDNPFHQTYTVEFLGNVVDGQQIHYLNLNIDKLMELSVAQTKNLAIRMINFGNLSGNTFDYFPYKITFGLLG